MASSPAERTQEVRGGPFAVFAGSPAAALGVGLDGRVIFCTAAAERLLGGRGASRCWELARLAHEDGTPLCRPSCPFREAARVREALPGHVLCRTARGRGVALFLFFVPGPDGRAGGILHLLADTGEPQRPVRGTEVRGHEALSPREREVLAQLSNGLSTGDVAERLFISPATVRNHVRHILAKLGVHSRLAAVRAVSRTE
jgi:DNA-binding CsgD family transcriptional regulator